MPMITHSTRDNADLIENEQKTHTEYPCLLPSSTTDQFVLRTHPVPAGQIGPILMQADAVASYHI